MKLVDIPNEIIERSQLLKEGKNVYGEDFEILLNFSEEVLTKISSFISTGKLPDDTETLQACDYILLDDFHETIDREIRHYGDVVAAELIISAKIGYTRSWYDTMLTEPKIYEKGLFFRSSNTACKNWSGNGWLDCLKWAKEKGCPWDELTCACAAENGHLDCLNWAQENGCPGI